MDPYNNSALAAVDPALTYLSAALNGAIPVPQDAGAAYVKELSVYLGNAINGAAQSGQTEGGDSG